MLFAKAFAKTFPTIVGKPLGTVRRVNIRSSLYVHIPTHNLHRKMLFIRLTLYLQDINNGQNPNLLPITIPAKIRGEELAGVATGNPANKKREEGSKTYNS